MPQSTCSAASRSLRIGSLPAAMRSSTARVDRSSSASMASSAVSREAAHRGDFEHRAELERLVDQRDADVGDLDAALRNQPHEALGLQPLQRFARRAERHVEQLAQLALRHELSGHQVALEELHLEALVGDFAHQRFRLRLFHALPIGRRAAARCRARARLPTDDSTVRMPTEILLVAQPDGRTRTRRSSRMRMPARCIAGLRCRHGRWPRSCRRGARAAAATARRRHVRGRERAVLLRGRARHVREARPRREGRRDAERRRDLQRARERHRRRRPVRHVPVPDGGRARRAGRADRPHLEQRAQESAERGPLGHRARRTPASRPATSPSSRARRSASRAAPAASRTSRAC